MVQSRLAPRPSRARGGVQGLQSRRPGPDPGPGFTSADSGREARSRVRPGMTLVFVMGPSGDPSLPHCPPRCDYAELRSASLTPLPPAGGGMPYSPPACEKGSECHAPLPCAGGVGGGPAEVPQRCHARSVRLGSGCPSCEIRGQG